MTSNRLLSDNQKYSLELGVFFHDLCEKHGLKYSLFGESLWGSHVKQGFLPWSSSMSFVMPYKDYMSFIEICSKEINKTQYYMANQETRSELGEFITVLVKRSKVTLPEDRKKDEFYYDFSIKIIPLLNVSDTFEEYKTQANKCKKFKEVLDSRLPVRGSFVLGNIKNYIKESYLSSQDKEMAQEQLEAVFKQGVEAKEYVIVPWDEWMHKGSVIKADTYQDIKLMDFEGQKFYGLTQDKMWLEDYYGTKFTSNKGNFEVNQMSMVGPEIARRVQLVELEMLIEIDRICRKHNIKYSLFAGTLLGAIRHGGFIPWDDDVDVCMLQEDYEKFMEIAPKELDAKKYFLRTQETDKDCNLTFAQLKRNDTLYYRKARNQYDTHLGIFVDIFPLYNGTDNFILHKIQHKCCRFFKTMLWAHMGASTESSLYYKMLAKVSNKTSYKWYLKFAKMSKNNNSKRVCYLAAIRNPYNEYFSKRSTYTQLQEVEFEGHKFFAPLDIDAYLEYCYSREYMSLPKLEDRIAKHTAAHVDVGGLYEL